MATDYDEGKVTPREKKAANRQTKNAIYNANAIKNQLDQQLYTYDVADKQNRELRDLQRKQARRKTQAERFEADRNLQNAALGLFGSMGPSAMNGSSLYNTMYMLESRNDADNSTHWDQLRDNLDTVNNAYLESYNQNQLARRDAAVNASKAISDLQGDLSTNLANINPNLFEKPGSNKKISKIANQIANTRKEYSKANVSQPKFSGYIMPRTVPEQKVQTKKNNAGARRNKDIMYGNDYFSRLMNGFTRM